MSQTATRTDPKLFVPHQTSLFDVDAPTHGRRLHTGRTATKRRGAGRPPVFRGDNATSFAPAGATAKLKANIAALRVLDECRDSQRWATPEQQAVLARWSGWGAIPAVFDENAAKWATEREEIRGLLRTNEAWAAARRTVLNAHYTPPVFAAAIWDFVAQVGATRPMRVLEPGCGSGNFIHTAPAAASVVGVEMDRTTADIAEHLYGADANIICAPFEETSLPGGFDVAIGNVPFASITPYDPEHNRGRHTLHNYFLVKSLELTRPGGYVAALTSRYTLDALNPRARREMWKLADLVAAVRFPAKAFAEVAGTDVVADLVIFRRRPDNTDRGDSGWVDTQPVDVDGVTVDINEHFARRPDHILGELVTTRGMYRDGELAVTATGDVRQQLVDTLTAIVDETVDTGLGYIPATRTTSRPVEQVTTDGYMVDHCQNGSFAVNTINGDIAVLHGTTPVPYTPNNINDYDELAHLIRLRDGARAALAAQTSDANTLTIRSTQAALAVEYDNYTVRYGPINRSTRTVTRTGVTRTVRPTLGGFRADPDWPLGAALEIFDDETQTARPAPIFTQRVVSPTRRAASVDTPAEAVAVCLDETSEVTLRRVAELLDLPPTVARQQLGTLVYDDPTTGQLVPAAQYLSGNIRAKLVDCETAADADRYQPNIEALRAVLPPQLQPGEITAKLGAPWIPATDIEQFCTDLLNARIDVEHHPGLGRWAARNPWGNQSGLAFTSEWGTPRANAVTLIDASLNQRLHTVYNTTADGRRTRDDTETLNAREKQEAVETRFAAWVWENPQRAERLAATYNDMYSSHVAPTHDGAHLTLPGLADTFTPRPHQRSAIARIVTDGRALLAHTVGAGKTATMIIAAMELRRLGLATKPAVVVPNHMLEQFTREWLQLYPTARIMVADNTAVTKTRRKEFVARAATGDWDGIIFTQSTFGRIKVGAELMGRYMSAELSKLRHALAESEDGKKLSVKKLERRIAQREQATKQLLAQHRKDDGVRFEETGIDYLMIDEAHHYKNLRVDTGIDSAASTGSQRAQDLESKLWVLRRQYGHRVVTFATATPIANAIAEMWVMQTYLHPDLLEEHRIRPFDAWAANFGRTHTAIELAPDGASYRMQTRFARYQNVTELLSLYRQIADVRNADDINLPTPNIVGGAAQVVVTPPSDALRDYIRSLADRAEQVRRRAVSPHIDNMLKIAGDGRRAALDMRLVDEPAPGTAPTKTRTAAEHIASIYHTTKNNEYAAPDGTPSNRRGALQLVFCDLSTPTTGWNVYQELSNLLTEHGIPANQIRYMQDSKTDAAKADLFAACRDGRVSVLIGSTETMGVGTNVQTRAVAVHHLDAPWRPADIEQREGRVLRQGNQNPDVHVVRYVTEGSFDTYMWQTLQRKAGFIAQVTASGFTDRSVDDLSTQELSFAEVKALATGDPLILEKAGVDADVARLARLERAHYDDQAQLRRRVDTAERTLTTHERALADMEAAAAVVVDTTGDKFSMTIEGVTHRRRVDAGRHLQQVLRQHRHASIHTTRIGTLGGLEVTIQPPREHRYHDIKILVPAAHAVIHTEPGDLHRDDPSRIVQRLETKLRSLHTRIDDSRNTVATAQRDIVDASERIGKPFDRSDELVTLRRRQTEIAEHLAAQADCPDTTASTEHEGS